MVFRFQVLLDVCGGEEETTLVAVTLALPMLCFCSSIEEAMATEVGSDKGWNNISKTSENNKGLLGAGRETKLKSPWHPPKGTFSLLRRGRSQESTGAL